MARDGKARRIAQTAAKHVDMVAITAAEQVDASITELGEFTSQRSAEIDNKLTDVDAQLASAMTELGEFTSERSADIDAALDQVDARLSGVLTELGEFTSERSAEIDAALDDVAGVAQALQGTVDELQGGLDAKLDRGAPITELAETDTAKVMTARERAGLADVLLRFLKLYSVKAWAGASSRAPLWVDGASNELLGADASPADGISYYRGHFVNWLSGTLPSAAALGKRLPSLGRTLAWSGAPTRAPLWVDSKNNELLGADAAPTDGVSYYRGHLIEWLRSNLVTAKSIASKLAQLSRLSSWTGSTTRSPLWIDAASNLLLGANSAPADGVSYYEGHFHDYIVSRAGASVGYTPVALAAADKPAPASAAGWIGLIAYGQSLSVGAQGQPVLTTTQPYANLTHSGGVKSPAGAGLVGTRALYEDALGEDNATGTNRGETICSTAANFLTRRYMVNKGAAPTDCIVFTSAPGKGGTSINGLSKGTPPYNRMLAQVTAAMNEAAAAGKTYRVVAMPWIQSETDSDNGTTYAAHLAAIKKLVDDVNADIIAITGQSTPVHLLLFQTAYKAASYGQMQLAQLQAVREHRLIHLVTNYGFVPYNADKVHSTNIGYIWLGHYAARAAYQLIELGQKPDCIMPLSATFTGLTLRVKFRTPTRLKLPAAPVQTGWGFKVVDDSGAMTITAATVSTSGDEVLLTVNRAPGANPQVRYALDYLAANNITGGAAGDLTDSTTTTASINGSIYPLVHRAPAFQVAAYAVEA